MAKKVAPKKLRRKSGGNPASKKVKMSKLGKVLKKAGGSYKGRAATGGGGK